ncbi:MAG: DUF4347 domain-containing protein [Candidatus Accumulibacter sp.]|nr:DUF4347 domain-containing protein [Candidatus Accumulibacter conexus]
MIGTAQQMVFIDATADVSELLAACPPGSEVIRLTAGGNGVREIATHLAGRRGIDSIHIVSHGRPGSIQLGVSSLSNSTLAEHADALAAIGGALRRGGDILLYGCDVAAGDEGADFLRALAAATGADVAASDDRTGNAALGGDWSLEATSGAIESTGFATAAALAAYDGVLADDYAADPSTTGSITPGSPVTGEIENLGDIDWFRVRLIGGVHYRVDLEGSDTGKGTLSDPYFGGIYADAGALIAGTADDDSGTGLNSRFEFVAAPTGTGTYYLAADAYYEMGSYTLSISAAVLGTNGPDSMTGSLAADFVKGLSGNDTLSGEEGNDTLYGGLGNDSLDGGEGKDDIYGQGGNDTLTGGGSADIFYVWDTAGDTSAETITDFAAGFAGDTIPIPVIPLSNYNYGDPFDSGHARLTQAGADTRLEIDLDGLDGPASFQLAATLQNVSKANLVAENFGADPGDSWKLQFIIGTSAGDVLVGTAAGDQVRGLAGNDTLTGGAAKDTFHVWDTAADTSADTITDFTAGWEGDTIRIPLARLSNYNYGGDPFDSGHTRLKHVGADTRLEIDLDGFTGPAAFQLAATLQNVSKSSLVSENFGDASWWNPQTLIGTSAADVLVGTAASEVLRGLLGNDTLTGSGGTDTFHVWDTAADTSADTITDFAAGAGGDTIRIPLARLTNHGSGDPFYSGHARLVQSGADTRLEIDVDGLDGPGGFQLVATLQNVSKTTLIGQNLGDPAWKPQTLIGSAAGDVLVGTAASEVLRGLSGNDTLTGGAGTDTFHVWETAGDTSADTITDFTAGAGGDTIRIPLARLTNYAGGDPFDSGHVRLTPSGADTRFEVDLDGLQGPGAFQLAATLQNVSKSSLIWQNLGDMPWWNPQTLIGTAAADSLVGTAASEVLRGLAGNDTLTGGAGRDTFHFWDTAGDTSADTITDFTAGWDGDTIRIPVARLSNYSGGDPFDSGHARLTQSGADTLLEVDRDGFEGPGAFQLLVTLQNVAKTNVDAQNLGGDPRWNPQTLIGTVAADVLVGTAANEVMSGLSGNDTLTGGGGTDSFSIWNVAGDVSTDTITDFAAGARGDTIRIPVARLGNYLGGDPFDSGHARLTQSGADTRLEIDLDGFAGPAAFQLAATLQNVSKSSLVSENLGNASWWNPQTLIGTSAADVLVGTAASEVLTGLLGNDTLTGSHGTDTFHIWDTAADTSADTITDFMAGAGGDTIRIPLARLTNHSSGDPFYSGHARLVQSGADTRLEIDVDGLDGPAAFQLAATLQSVSRTTLIGQNLGDAFWKPQTLIGSAASEVLVGTAASEVLRGLAGNDTLTGGAGRDTFHFWDTAGDTSADTITDFTAGAGGDTIRIPLARLANYGGGDPFDSGHVRLVQSGADTRLEIDVDGRGGPATFQALATLQNVTKSGLIAQNLGDMPWWNPQTLIGTAFADVLVGSVASEVLRGLAGNDTLTGGAGTDTFYFWDAVGDTSVDTITDFAAGIDGDRLRIPVDSLTNFAGGDPFYSGHARLTQSGADTQLAIDVDGLDGPATFQALATLQNVSKNSLVSQNFADTPWWNPQTVLGSALADVLVGSVLSEVLRGLAGNDTLTGGAGTDTFLFWDTVGDTSVDTITDFAAGIDGDRLRIPVDRLTNYSGDDPFYSGHARLTESGTDTLLEIDLDGLQGPGSFQLAATLHNVSKTSLVWQNFGDASSWNPQTLIGTAAADVLVGTAVNEVVRGLAGRDTVTGGAGTDTFHLWETVGDTSADTITDFTAGWDGDTIRIPVARLSNYNYVDPFDSGHARVRQSGADSLLEFDLDGFQGPGTFQLAATLQNVSKNSLISQNFGGTTWWNPQTLIGGAVADVLAGTAANEVLRGLAGNDTLTGGAGTDTFHVWDTVGDTSNDTITDFAAGSGDDTIRIPVARLTNYFHGDPFDSGHARLTQAGADTRLEIDPDGPDGPGTFLPAATLQNVTKASLVSQNFGGESGWNPQSLIGTSAPEVLVGTAAGEVIKGFAGNDTLTGGAGRDTFHFWDTVGDTSADTITDFTAGWNGDTIRIPVTRLSNYSGGDPFDSGHARLTQSGADTRLEIDLDGLDGPATFQLAATLQNVSKSAVIGDNVGDGFWNPQTLIGTAAADVLVGTAANEVMSGLSGNDTLTGGGGTDSFSIWNVAGDASTDTITDFSTGARGDTIRIPVARLGSYLGGDPFDSGHARLTQSGADTRLEIDLDGFAGPAAFQLAATLQNVSKGSFVWQNFGNASWWNPQTLIGTSAADVLVGTAASEVLRGLLGNDTLTGSHGTDTFHIWDTAADTSTDTITDFMAGAGGDTIRIPLARLTNCVGDPFASGHVRLTQSGADTRLEIDLDGLEGPATVQLAATLQNVSKSSLISENFGDTPWWNPQTLIGTAAADSLVGTAAREVLRGLAGNDTLTGGAGPDTFHIWDTAGDTSADTITDFTAGMDGDTIPIPLHRLSNYTAADPFDSGHARLTQSGADTRLEIDLDGLAGPATFQLAATLQNVSKSALIGQNVGDAFWNPQTLIGTSAADVLVGTAASEMLYGLAGNDTLTGGAGADTFSFWDTVADVSTDTITDFTAGTGGDTIRIPLARLRNHFGGSPFDSGHARLIQLGGDTRLEIDLDGLEGPGGLQLAATLRNVSKTSLIAHNFGGDPTWNPQTLIGTAGADVLVGTAASEILRGLPGNDTLTGSAGTDTFHVWDTPEDTSTDTITDFTAGTGGDTIRIPIARLTNYFYGDPFYSGHARLTQAGAETRLEIDLDGLEGPGVLRLVATLQNVGKNSLVGQNLGDPSWNPQTLIGTAAADALVGTAADEVFRGLAADDTLTGGAGMDTFHTWDTAGDTSADTITDFTAGSGGDTIRIPVARLSNYGYGDPFHSGHARVTQSGADTRLEIDLDGLGGPGAFQLLATLQNVAKTNLNGHNLGNASWNPQTLIGSAATDVLVGTAADEVFRGLAGNDILTGGAGMDTFHTWDTAGDTSVDTITDFTAGSAGDTIRIPVDRLANRFADDPFQSGHARLTQAGAATLLEIDLDGIGGPAPFQRLVTLQNVSKTSLNGQNFGNASWNPQTLIGTAAADMLVGTAVDEVLRGLAGNDTLTGGAGTDTFHIWDAAGDTSADTITDFTTGSGGDTARIPVARLTNHFGDDPFHSGHARLTQAGADTRLEIDRDGLDGAGAFQLAATLQNVSKTSLVGQNFGDASWNPQTLIGTAGADALVGTAVNEVLRGLAGNDTLTGGPGSDTFLLWDVAGDTSADTITDFTAGAGGDRIPVPLIGLSNYFGGDPFYSGHARLAQAGADTRLEIDRDGLDGPEAFRLAATLQNVSDTSLTGHNLGDGSWTPRVIMGTAAADVLVGTTAAEALRGLTGSDTLTGGAGTDTFHVWDAFGDSSTDTITDFVAGTGGDTIRILLARLTHYVVGGDPFDCGHVRLTQSGADTRLEIDLDGFDGAAAFQLAATLQNVVKSSLIGQNFGDASWNPQTIIGTWAADVLIGTAANEVIRGIAGNDTLQGGEGDDTLAGGSGSDSASYVDAAAGVSVNLATVGVQQNTLGAGHDILSDIENLAGSAFADTLSGDGNANYLSGGSGDDSLDGGAGNDTLDGGAGSDRLWGGLGADSLIGGDGSDSYYVDHIGDSVTESKADAAAGGIDLVCSSLAAYTLGAHIESGRILNTGAANLTGNGLDNLLEAGSGANVLDGAGGIDTVSYLYGASRGVSVSLAVSGPQATTGSGSDTLISIENLGGSTYADLLRGDGNANILAGAQGNDFLDGGAGNDSLAGDSGNDTLWGGSGADSLIGGDGNDAYYLDNPGDSASETNANPASGGVDQAFSYLAALTLGTHIENGRILAPGVANLSGNDLDNVLEAGSGNNVLDGAGGIDTASYLYGASSGVSVSLAVSGAQATGGSGSDTLIHVENLTGSTYADLLRGDHNPNLLSGAQGNDFLDGGAGSDTLDGGNGNDTLWGGTGGDSLVGGDGNDAYYLDHPGDSISETNADPTSGGTDQVFSYLTALTIGACIENGRILSVAAADLNGNGLDNVLHGGTGANILDGGAGNDTLDGGAGNDTLWGGTGADSLLGGDGNDAYYLDHAGDSVSETNPNPVSGGIDQVFSSLATHTLGANVENGRILTSGIADLNGNGLDNVLEAGTGNNRLEGGAGRDTVSYLYGASKSVSVSLAIAGAQATGGSGSDTLIGIENLVGSTYTDLLRGDANANLLAGAQGNDFLDGGAGSDTLDGGAGNDTLWGGTGADSLLGGDGSDAYYLDHAGDSVSETNANPASGGTDQVFSYLATLTLGANVENGRILAPGVANLSGNGLDNLLEAGSGSNILDGAGGIDTASYLYGASSGVSVSLAIAGAQATGGSGIDTLVGIENLSGSTYADLLRGDGSANLLSGVQGDDFLDGGAGSDTLDGGSGNDTLWGGTGADSLVGGDGNDAYYLDHAGDSVSETNANPASGGTDQVFSYLASCTLAANVENGRILATGAANLNGNGLDNLLQGGSGNNRLAGGTGNDTLLGGSGADFFRFDTLPNAATNRDMIGDFNVLDDTIGLENAVFASLATGPLAAGSFRSGAGITAAADADDFVIYDSSSGALYYDANGNAGAGPVQIASLGGGLALSPVDFLVT